MIIIILYNTQFIHSSIFSTFPSWTESESLPAVIRRRQGDSLNSHIHACGQFKSFQFISQACFWTVGGRRRTRREPASTTGRTCKLKHREAGEPINHFNHLFTRQKAGWSVFAGGKKSFRCGMNLGRDFVMGGGGPETPPAGAPQSERNFGRGWGQNTKQDNSWEKPRGIHALLFVWAAFLYLFIFLVLFYSPSCSSDVCYF